MLRIRKRVAKTEGERVMRYSKRGQALLVSLLLTAALCATVVEASAEISAAFIVVRQLHCVF